MRRIAAAVAVLLFPALALAGPAQAAITTSTITSPADNFAQLVTGVGPTFTPATFKVSGTSNGTTGDKIQVRAYYGTAPLAHDTVGPDISVAADGTWSTSVPLAQGSGIRPYGAGTLYAVPPSAPATLPNSANFHPTRATSDAQTKAVSSGLPTDFWFIHTGTQGFFDAYGVADCSVCDTAIYDSATRSRGNYLWYGAGLNNNENGKYGAPRAYFRVDSRNVVFPSGVNVSGTLAGNSGLKPTSVTFTNGAEPSVTDVEPALRCTNATPFPPANNSDCGALVDTGVRDSMTIQSANGGRRQVVTHRFASTNGAPHDVDAHLSAFANNPSAGNEQFQMQWMSDGFVLPAAGQTFPGPPAADTVLYRQNKNVPGGSAEFPIGALTISPAPQFIQFNNETPPREFIMPYRTTVSPGQDLVVKQQFDTEPTLAAAQAAGAAARAAFNTAPDVGATGRTGTAPGAGVNGPTNSLPALAAASGLGFSNTSFRAESSGPSATNAKKASPPRGTKVSFQLNEAATVRFTVTRRANGRKVKSGKKTRCAAPTRKNRTGKRCTRVVTLKGSFTRNGVGGANSFHFTGRLAGKKLHPGRYQLVATPTAAGKQGKSTSKGFRIVR